ncbi:MAG: outer membrane beta-barrel protein [Bacteroidota bacterium]
MKNAVLRIVFVLACHILTFQSPAQNVLDYIITHNQDTIFGDIKANAYDYNAVRFFPRDANDEKTFKAEDIKGFWADGIPYFSMYKMSEENGPILFWQLLVKGYVTLWRSPEGFILERDGDFIELFKEDQVREGVYYWEDKKYQGILKFNLADCENLTNEVFDNLDYTPKALTNLIAQYNECRMPEEEQIVYSKKRKFKLNIGIQLGTNRSTIDWKDPPVDRSNSPFSSDEQPDWGTSVGFFIETPLSRNTSGILAINYSSHKASQLNEVEGSLFVVQEMSDFEFNFMELMVSYKWEFFNFNSHNVFLQGGGLFGFPLKKSHVGRSGSPTWDANTVVTAYDTLSEGGAGKGGGFLGIGVRWALKNEGAILMSFQKEYSGFRDYRLDVNHIRVGYELPSR